MLHLNPISAINEPQSIGVHSFPCVKPAARICYSEELGFATLLKSKFLLLASRREMSAHQLTVFHRLLRWGSGAAHELLREI